MNLGLLGFLQGFTKSYLSDLENQQKKLLQEKQRQELLQKLFGTPGVENGISMHTKTPTVEEELAQNVSLLGQGKGLLQQFAQQYSLLKDKAPDVLSPEKYTLELDYEPPKGKPGLLSRQYLETGIPTIRDQIIAKVYGLGQLPQREPPKPPKVKGYDIIDTGEALIPLIVMDNGETIFPAQFYKKLSPKDRELIRLKQKEIGFKVRKLKSEEDWRNFQKWYKQQALGLQKQRIGIERQRLDIERQKQEQADNPINNLKRAADSVRRELEFYYKKSQWEDLSPEEQERVRILSEQLAKINNLLTELGVSPFGKIEPQRNIQQPQRSVFDLYRRQ